MSLFQDIWSFDGRVSRSHWWLGRLAHLLLAILASALVFVVLGKLPDDLVLAIQRTMLPIALLVAIWVVYAYWGLGLDAQRWHDLNLSGRHSLVGFIPIFGPIFVLCGLGFKGGFDGPNRYGLPLGSGPRTAE